MIHDIDVIEIAHQIVHERNDDGDESFDDLIPSGALVVTIYAAPNGTASAVQYACVGGGMNAYAYEGVLRNMLRDVEQPSDPDGDA
jgi:hypothetical protein